MPGARGRAPGLNNCFHLEAQDIGDRLDLGGSQGREGGHGTDGIDCCLDLGGRNLPATARDPRGLWQPAQKVP